MFQETLQKILAGNEEAFTLLVREYLPAMRRAARRELDAKALRGDTGSDDVSQNVFVLFFERIREGKIHLKDERHLGNLLLKMVHDDVVRLARRERAARRNVGRRAEVAVEKLALAAPAELPLSEEGLAALEADFLARLEAAEERLYLARKLTNSWPQVEAATGIEAETARFRYARIIVKFLDAIERYGSA